jgi:hypothetical protein
VRLRAKSDKPKHSFARHVVPGAGCDFQPSCGTVRLQLQKINICKNLSVRTEVGASLLAKVLE